MSTLQLLAALLDREPAMLLLVILLSAAAMFAFTMGAASVVLAAADPLRRRLAQVGQVRQRTTSLAASLADYLRPYGRYLLPKKERELSRVGQLLLHAGYRSPNALPLYFAAKAILMAALPVAVFLAAPFFPKVPNRTLLVAAVVVALLGFLAPSVWLDRRAKSRQRELRAGFPDAMDLLVVCVEAGLGLAPALQRVADDLAVSYPDLGTELALVNAEIRAGVDRSQALKNLAERTGLEDIRGLVALLVQTMRFGTGIADALRVYSEEFRDKRMQAAEEVAAKIGTKMIFPLVLCLFPSFFVIAVGPAAISLAHAFKGMHH